MSRSLRAFVGGLVVTAVAVCPGQGAKAEENPGHLGPKVFSRFVHHKHDTPPPGKKRVIPHTFERAGYPLCLSDHAQPTDSPEYQTYYVGGSAPLEHGDAGCAHEGTFGWDYVGAWYHRRVALGWNHGRHYQSGSGFYRTDGPPVKDPVATTTTKIRSHGFKGESE